MFRHIWDQPNSPQACTSFAHLSLIMFHSGDFQFSEIPGTLTVSP